jgi:DNA (cytosine-5)-methyltransferase 1
MSHQVFSFFAGSGFLDLGFEHAGFQIAYVNDNTQAFLAAYEYARKPFNSNPPSFGLHCASIETIQSTTINKMTDAARCGGAASIGFIGGPPCPDFSVGGKNAGQHGENGRLAQTYVDLICACKPDWFLFENVKGLVRTSKHRAFFMHLCSQLEDAGYNLSHQLMNALEYGVPQDRDRLILVGFQAPTDITKLDWQPPRTHTRHVAISEFWPTVGSAELHPHTDRTLTVQHWFDKNNVVAHPNQQHGFKPRAGFARFQTIAEGDCQFKSYKRLHRWRYSPTAAYGHNEVHVHPYEPRRITAAEALAIQSMPAIFALPPTMTLTDMFKTIGNGVPYLMGRGIAYTLKQFLDGAA